jgi:succinate-semialdehyde dehydrogenase / glutarate-semialdehyde dehydrogenase
MPIASVNPATGERLRTFEPPTARALDALVARAADAFGRWRRTPVAERAAVVRRAGEILERDRARFARLMTLEMGKTLRAADEEAAKCAAGCRYYADHAERLMAPAPVEGAGADEYVAYEPLGVVLAVMPWNFPFWQVIRFAAPALVAGNVGLLKHASNVPQCALALERLFLDAGAPEGAFTALLVGSDAVAGLLADPRVAAATLTGSEPAGRQVAATAGRELQKTVLELGGSDPFVVMPSADVARAAAVAVKARAINNGQSCIAAKRFVVHERVYDDFRERFVAGVRALRVGDPAEADTDVGPLATRAIRDELVEQVQRSVALGATLLVGGHAMDGPGNFFAPAVLESLPPSAPVAREETFGPVAALFRVASEADAVRVANDTTFGLGASVWTTDREEARRFAQALEAGQVFVNGMVVSDPRFPFGGVKHSGYGRELGAFGLREFVNVKTVRMVFDGGAGAGAETE